MRERRHQAPFLFGSGDTMTDIHIRDAAPDDLASITQIYANEVINGHASFELVAPTKQEMARRFHQLRENKYPYLVATQAESVAGYAYFSAFRPRPAYRWTVENSVYVAGEHQGKGIGKKLLTRLIELAENAGYRQMMAIVGDTQNHGSIGLHKSCGFEVIGIQNKVGWKHGMWIDCVMLQRALGPGSKTPPDGDPTHG